MMLTGRPSAYTLAFNTSKIGVRSRGASSVGLRLIRSRIAAAILALCAATACVADRYASVDLRPGRAAIEIQSLARRAQSGDKQAQFALGERYKIGDGVVGNHRLARRLYARAAVDSGGVRYVHAPKVRGGTPGSVARIDLGPRLQGIAAAGERLRAMDLPR